MSHITDLVAKEVHGMKLYIVKIVNTETGDVSYETEDFAEDEELVLRRYEEWLYKHMEEPFKYRVEVHDFDAIASDS